MTQATNLPITDNFAANFNRYTSIDKTEGWTKAASVFLALATTGALSIAIYGIVTGHAFFIIGGVSSFWVITPIAIFSCVKNRKRSAEKEDLFTNFSNDALLNQILEAKDQDQKELLDRLQKQNFLNRILKNIPEDKKDQLQEALKEVPGLFAAILWGLDENFISQTYDKMDSNKRDLFKNAISSRLEVHQLATIKTIAFKDTKESEAKAKFYYELTKSFGFEDFDFLYALQDRMSNPDISQLVENKIEEAQKIVNFLHEILNKK